MRTPQNFREALETLRHDFFPPRREVQEDGIHAKLNYQSIADSQRRTMSLLMILIIMFSIGFVISIYLISTGERMVAKEDFKNYSSYMNEIRQEVLNIDVDSTKAQGQSKNQKVPRQMEENEERMLEDNTSMYWSVFFSRFLLVRILIGITLGIILTFLIRVYFRIRQDRAVNIHKEEALSTIQYVARGEWRLSYNNTAKRYEDVDYITNNADHVLTTEQLLKTLPINSLFKAPTDNHRGRKRSNQSSEAIVDLLSKMNSKLSEIDDELHDIRKKVYE